MTGATGETEASAPNALACSAAVRLHTRAPTQACSADVKAALSTPKAAFVLTRAHL